MLNNLFSSILTSSSSSIQVGTFLICSLVSLLLGGVIAYLYTIKNRYTKSFVITLALLPAIVQMVIMLVNGNLGAGVAVAGAFSLVRFRSAPGTAKEIVSIFLSMTVGLSTAMGYIGIAILFVIIIECAWLTLTLSSFGDAPALSRILRITVPESLNYTDVFKDVLEKYTSAHTLYQVKTTNMGSLFKLTYDITLKNDGSEKDFIDELRCRNGNLEISCSMGSEGKEELL